MAFDYNKLYGEKPQALGEPTQILVKFFNQIGRADLHVLDIGCGQGRDALFIARRGHSVVGVDYAPNGINELLSVAQNEQLKVTGVVADIETYEPNGIFDIVLIDRTLHMLKLEPRLAVLERLLRFVAVDGWVLIADEASNIEAFKAIFERQRAIWTIQYAHRGYLFVQRNYA